MEGKGNAAALGGEEMQEKDKRDGGGKGNKVMKVKERGDSAEERETGRKEGQ